MKKQRYIEIMDRAFGAYTEENLTENHILPVLFAESEYPTLVVTPEDWGTVPVFDKVTVTCEQGIAYNESDELYAYYTIGWDYTQFEFDNVNVVQELIWEDQPQHLLKTMATTE